MELNLGLIIPFIGTTIGAPMGFLMKNEINRKVEKFLLGFASGVMIAASVWSLLMPSIEMAREQGVIAWLPASVGLIIGILFLLWIDYITTKIKEQKQDEKQSSHKKKSMLFLAVTLHNIPEGMAVRSSTCWSIAWKCWNNNEFGFSISNWNRNSKLSRRSNNFNAFKK